MSSSDALAAHLEWQPFAHRADCAKPVWEIDQQTEADKRRSRREGPEHTCPNEECGHRDHYDRVTVRVLCRSCGTDGHAERTPRLRAAVAAAPMVDTVGELRALLEQLPDEMPLHLDDHHRALPGEADQVHTIHPRLVATVSGLATEAETNQPGLMLTQVYVPFPAEEEEQVAVATREDLPAYGELPRAAHHLEGGELRAGLKDVAEVLAEVAHLVGEVAADFTEHEDGSQLRVEAQRITHAAERVGKLAGTVEEVTE